MSIHKLSAVCQHEHQQGHKNHFRRSAHPQTSLISSHPLAPARRFLQDCLLGHQEHAIHCLSQYPVGIDACLDPKVKVEKWEVSFEHHSESSVVATIYAMVLWGQLESVDSYCSTLGGSISGFHDFLQFSRAQRHQYCILQKVNLPRNRQRNRRMVQCWIKRRGKMALL